MSRFEAVPPSAGCFHFGAEAGMAFIRRERFDWQLVVSRQCVRGREVCPQTSAGCFVFLGGGMRGMPPYHAFLFGGNVLIGNLSSRDSVSGLGRSAPRPPRVVSIFFGRIGNLSSRDSVSGMPPYHAFLGGFGGNVLIGNLSSRDSVSGVGRSAPRPPRVVSFFWAEA